MRRTGSLESAECRFDPVGFRKGDERGTAPPEDPASNAGLVYEPVDDGWPGHDESPYQYH